MISMLIKEHFVELSLAIQDVLSQINIIYYGIIFVAALILYLLFRPLNRVRTLTETGWDFLLRDKLRGRTLAEAVAQVQKMRKIGNLPRVFPNGWFAIADSNSLAPGQVKSIMALGETFAVFRSEEGEVHILDAYCPHLGANLAVGGVVKGNCIECPFHGWKFNGQDGKCTVIPYAEKVPESAKIKRWESREINGLIFVWYDAELRPPFYEIPSVTEIQNGLWTFKGRTEHEVLAHIQEIPENGSDLAHLGHLHAPNVFKGSDLNKSFKKNKLLDIVTHHWEGQWAAQEAPNAHVAHLDMKHSWSFFSGRIHLFETKVSIKQIGPSVVYLFFETAIGNGVLIQTVTPIEPLRQRLTHQFYAAPSFLTPIGKILLLLETYHVERDIMIWNNKRYLPNPHLVKEDKLIAKYRRWYAQFYSTNSPTLQSIRDKSLDW